MSTKFWDASAELDMTSLLGPPQLRTWTWPQGRSAPPLGCPGLSWWSTPSFCRTAPGQCFNARVPRARASWATGPLPSYATNDPQMTQCIETLTACTQKHPFWHHHHTFGARAHWTRVPGLSTPGPSLGLYLKTFTAGIKQVGLTGALFA